MLKTLAVSLFAFAALFCSIAQAGPRHHHHHAPVVHVYPRPVRVYTYYTPQRPIVTYYSPAPRPIVYYSPTGYYYPTHVYTPPVVYYPNPSFYFGVQVNR
jgi:hypothetical protein